MKHLRKLWLLLLLPFIYLAVQIFIILAPRMRTDVVQLDTMTDSLALRGWVVLESAPVMGASGRLYYPVPAGQRVTAGAEVAQVFASAGAAQARSRLDAVDAQIAQLQNAQNTAAQGGNMDELLSQMQAGLYGMIDGIERGDYANLAGARGEVTLAANRIQISTGDVPNFEALMNRLTAEKLRLERQAVPASSVTAPATGYFCPSQTQDRLQLSFERADAMSPAQLRRALDAEPRYYGAGVVGHVVLDYRWHFFTVLPLQEAAKFSVGDKSLRISFPDAGAAALPVTVEKVTEDAETGLCLVGLVSEYISPEILPLRVERAEIIFGEEKGIRIEKNALRLADVPNDDGSVTTYQGVYVKFGNMVYFRRIRILVDDGYYMLVPDTVEEGVNEVELYDEVVMDSGGVELYDRKIL